MVGGIGGFRYSTDGGTTWTPSNTGLTTNTVNSFAVAGNTVLTSATEGVFRSTDNGTSWAEVHKGGGSSLALNGGSVYAAGGGVYRSQDSGASWSIIDTGAIGDSLMPLFVNGKYFFAGNVFTPYLVSLFADTTPSLYRSPDSGKTWMAITSNLPYYQLIGGAGDPVSYSYYDYIQSFAAIGKTLFAGIQGNYVYRSTDSGTTWSLASTGLADSNLCLATSGSLLFAGTASGGAFLSRDSGTSWTAINTGLTNTNIQALFVNGSDLFAGTKGGGIFHSADTGKLWTAFNNGLTDSSIQSFGVNGEYLFAGVGPGTYGGSVWRYPLSQVGVTSVQKAQPDQASLKVYTLGRYDPNVSIAFSIPGPERVSVAIYDLSGHLVTTLDDKIFSGGQHTLSWNTRTAGSGCYVVRMQAGGSVQVREVPVVR